MSKDKIISSVAGRLRETPSGDLFRRATAWFTAPKAENGLPTEPDARSGSELNPEGDRSGGTDPAAWTRLNELHDRMDAEANTVTRNLVETLRALYPSAHALEMCENEDGVLLTVRLVSADGSTVRDLGKGPNLPTHLPELPETVRDLWPMGFLGQVHGLDRVVIMLEDSGVRFDNLPAELRDDDCPYGYIPALLLETE
ncbi:hypothetical protein ACFXKW_32050 [Streptomyces sp. NPDC059193]|uniref:hypothetical protein n=1 Tax=Streptomyces sp. NPDC059193 TaxID=3346763 RepID=UPI0036A745D7